MQKDVLGAPPYPSATCGLGTSQEWFDRAPAKNPLYCTKAAEAAHSKDITLGTYALGAVLPSIFELLCPILLLLNVLLTCQREQVPLGPLREGAVQGAAVSFTDRLNVGWCWLTGLTLFMSPNQATGTASWPPGHKLLWVAAPQG